MVTQASWRFNTSSDPINDIGDDESGSGDIGDYDDCTNTPDSSPAVSIAIMCIMYSIITLGSIGGNSLVCCVVFAYQRMRTVTNLFIVNLAIGDILMSCLCVPFTFVSSLVLQYWPFGFRMCVVVSYAQCVMVFVSAYTLVAISIDRYVVIMHPFSPRLTKFQAKVIIAMVWVVAILTTLPTALKLTLKPLPCYNSTRNRTETERDDLVSYMTDETYYYCDEEWESETYRMYYSYFLLVLQYFVPLSVLIVTYARIALVVWGKEVPGEAEDNRDKRLAASKRKMVKMMICVVSVYGFCWLPLNLYNILSSIDNSINEFAYISIVYFIIHWLAMSHTCYNPVIYCWMNAKFREGFVRLFCSINPRGQSVLTRRHTYTSYVSGAPHGDKVGHHHLQAQPLTVLRNGEPKRSHLIQDKNTPL